MLSEGVVHSQGEGCDKGPKVLKAEILHDVDVRLVDGRSGSDLLLPMTDDMD